MPRTVWGAFSLARIRWGGMTLGAAGWQPFGRAFGFANAPSPVADEIDALWRTIVAGLR